MPNHTNVDLFFSPLLYCLFYSCYKFILFILLKINHLIGIVSTFKVLLFEHLVYPQKKSSFSKWYRNHIYIRSTEVYYTGWQMYFFFFWFSLWWWILWYLCNSKKYLYADIQFWNTYFTKVTFVPGLSLDDTMLLRIAFSRIISNSTYTIHNDTLTLTNNNNILSFVKLH